MGGDGSVSRSRSPTRKSSRHRSRDRSSHKSSRHRNRSRDRSPHKSSRHRNRDRSRSRRHRSQSRRAESAEDGGEEAGEQRATDSPFGDGAAGNKKFVWKKKIEQDKAKWASRAEREEAERRRKEEAERELQSLRRRRELREIEQQQREQEMIRKRREQEQEKLGDWERREEEFHLQQAKRRAEIRIRNRRPKTVDVLAMNLRLANESLTDEELAEIGAMRVDVGEPHRMAEALGADEAQELLHDVEMYLSLEANARNVEFWENMAVVVAAHLADVRSGSGRAGVAEEVRAIMRGKPLDELLRLEEDVQAKLGGGGGRQGAAGVDVDYWEQVRAGLVVEKARATLSAMHADILERRLQRLHPARAAAPPGSAAGAVEQLKRRRLEELQRRILEGLPPEPAPEPASNTGGTAVGAAAAAAEERDVAREMYEQELRRDHDPSEAVFSVEAAMPARTYAWQDKHRPRKPRYLNRVHTGYEWNRYNQTHYDKDNPPPKVVQGYKFNIFYPDLIDRSQAPTYHVEKDPGDDETVVLRFSAGPPYEDVAFRIVNREWEYNRRRGFRNTFDRGVLQLHFRFKRHFYRR